MLAMRAYLPLEGAAGGMPGATTGLAVRRRDGSHEPISTAAAGVVVEAGEAFEIRCSSGGGVGDPLTREPAKVAADVARGLFSNAEAANVYGVVLRQGKVSAAATERKRSTIRQQRLRRAAAPALPFTGKARGLAGGTALPLYPGIRHQDGIAYAEGSGTPLARTPASWQSGCPVLESAPGLGPGIVTRAYLDPSDGTVLLVEAAPVTAAGTTESSPRHWA
jgi:N-methylhydantoinase B